MEENFDLNFMDAYLDKEYLYAASMKSNIFFKARRDNHYCVEALGIINGFQNKNAGGIFAVQYYKNSLYLFLDYTYEVARYDFETEKFFYYYPAEHNEVFDMVCGICRVGNEVWILRDTFEKELCVFSLEECGYCFFELDVSAVSDNIEKEKVKRVAKETICLVGNKIWRCVPGTNYLYSIDVAEKYLEIHKIESETEIFTINHSEKGFSCLSMSGEYVILWDADKGVTEKKEIDNGKKVFKAFRNMIQTNQGCLLIPGLSDEIKFLPEEGGTTAAFVLPPQFQRTKNVKGLFFGCFQDENKILLFPFGGNGLIEIHTDTLKSEYYPVCITKEEYMKALTAGNQSIIEDETVSLKNYIELLNAGLYGGKRMDSSALRSGKQIMKAMERRI